MLHYHQGPQLTIPYSVLPEVLICQDKDPGIVLKILAIKIETQLCHCSKQSSIILMLIFRLLGIV